MVTTPEEGPAVRGVEEGLDFVIGQERDQLRSKRLGGRARTRPIVPACSGWCSTAKRKNDRSADNRALRVRTLLCRSRSRCSQEPAEHVGVDVF